MLVGRPAAAGVTAASEKALQAKFQRARETGNLVLAGCGLDELPRAVTHMDENMSSDEKWWQCVDLARIDASHNEIGTLPDDLSPLSTLAALKLDHNRISSLPRSIAELTELKLLDVGHNPLGGLPREIGGLSSLVELHVESCGLSELPAELGACTTIEVLGVAGNALEALPADIGRLRRLLRLHASDNALGELPDSLSECSALQTLEVARNRIRRLPSLAAMRDLREVDFRENRIDRTPALPRTDKLQRLFLGYNRLRTLDGAALAAVAAGLVLLDVRDNALEEIPADVARLASLTTLDATNNDLGDLPPALGYVKPLRRIAVDGNPMRRVRRALLTGPTEALKKYLRTRGPPLEAAADGAGAQPVSAADVVAAGRGGALAVDGAEDYFGAAAAAAGPASGLQVAVREARASGRLDLRRRELRTLPLAALAAAGLGEAVHSLDAEGNALGEVDAALADALPGLQALCLAANRIERLPLALGSLRRLQLLDLARNALRDDAFAPFEQARAPLASALRVVRLGANALTSLPLALFACAELEEIHAGANRIGADATRLPWHRLPALHTVDLSANRLPEIPPALAAARSLTSLNVANNAVRRVPPALARLPALRALWLEGNPQREVPPHVLAQGTAAVVELLARRAEGVVPEGGAPVPADIDRSAPGTEWAPAEPAGRAPSRPAESLARREAQGIATRGAAAAEREALQEELRRAEAELADLRARMDDFSISRAKQHALKKDAARANARRIRIERQLGVRR